MIRRSQYFRDCLLLGLLLLEIPAFIPTVRARVWHVRANAIPPGNGSPEYPFVQIQSGAFRAVAGDTVLVHGGTYYETVKVKNSGEANADGGIRYIYYLAAGDGAAIVKAQNNFCFLIGDSTEFGEVNKKNYIWIEGFYLTRSFPITLAHAGAIRTFSDYGVFIHNHIYDNDIGIFCQGNGRYEESNNNRGNYIAHNVISNSVEAGVRLKHSSENDVVFNLFYHNGLGEPSGAVTFYCGVGNRIINNTFWNNRGWAVAIYNGTNSASCIASSNSDVRDNIFARSDPGLLLQVQEKTAADTSSTFSYNLFWGPDILAPLVEWGTDEFGQGGHFWNLKQYKTYTGQVKPLDSTGVFFADPQFVNPWEGKFDLQLFSPALDAGSRQSNQAPYRSSINALLQNPPDGVFASQLTVTVNQVLDDGFVDLGYHHLPMQNGINPTLLSQYSLDLYPNPFNGNGDLTFILPNVSHPRNLHGEIFDLQGRSVQTFRMPDEPLNIFHLRWNIAPLASGRYFLILKVEGRFLRQQIVLLK